MNEIKKYVSKNATQIRVRDEKVTENKFEWNLVSNSIIKFRGE